jgi:hypothetical protein
MARDLQRQRLREAMHAGLGCGIIGLPESALLPIDRRHIDDAPPFLLQHRLQHLLAHVEHAVEIGAQHHIPVVRRHLAQTLVARDAGVIDEHIAPSQFMHDVLEHRCTIGKIGDIDLVGKEMAACFLLAIDPFPGMCVTG